MLFLKGCRKRDIVIPSTPVQITPGLPTVTVFIPAVGSREKQCGDDGDDLITAVASHYRGEAVIAVIVTALEITLNGCGVCTVGYIQTAAPERQIVETFLSSTIKNRHIAHPKVKVKFKITL